MSYLKQGVKNKQKLIQDQNYSTQTFMTLMSTLQSILLCFEGQHQSQYNNKMFKHYDRVNYSSKNPLELKRQLQTQILLFQASRKVFKEQNPNEPWTSPSGFNQEHIQKFLHHAKEILKNCDQDCYYMVKDIESILKEQFKNLYSEKIKININYTPEQKSSFKNGLVSNSIFAGNQMNNRQLEANKYNDVSDIHARINKNSDYYQKSYAKEMPQQYRHQQEQQHQNLYTQKSKNGKSNGWP